MSTIANITTTTNPSSTLDRIPKKVLDQEDFLKLLVAQFTTQDPLKPQGDLSFIAQMAQFTSLEQTKVMQADIARLQADSQLATANSLIGRQVTLRREDQPPLTGEVTGVAITDGKPRVIVDNQPYALESVIGLVPGALAQNPLPQTQTP